MPRKGGFFGTHPNRPALSYPVPQVKEKIMVQTDKYGKHEVLHTASIIVDMFSDYICEHGAVKADKELDKEAKKAIEALCDFYQLCGRKFL